MRAFAADPDLKGLGIETAKFAPVDSGDGLIAALATVGKPAVLKTRRFGYDGKGQIMIRDGGDPAMFDELGGQAQILEAFVPFEREISVVAARGRDGGIESFDVIENEHEDHILKTSRVPANVKPAVAAEARHQRYRWGDEHDATKTAWDWFWALGYLGSKAAHAALARNWDKALHHTVTGAALFANWHRHLVAARDAGSEAV